MSSQDPENSKPTPADGEPPDSVGGRFSQLLRDGILALSASFSRKDSCSRRTTDDELSETGVQVHDTRIGSISLSLSKAIMEGLHAISGGMFKGGGGPKREEVTTGTESQPSSRTPARAAEVAKALRRTLEFATLSAFSGESIHKEVQPETHAVIAGETLEQIAADHLGGNASKQDIGMHVDEIERLNQVKRLEDLPDGRQLILPGHTSDGGTVLRDADGTRHTRWPDGVERVEREDGCGYARRSAVDGSFSERHWGPAAENNYDLVRDANGQYRIEGKEAGPGDRRVARAMWFTQGDLHTVEQTYGVLDRRLQSLEQKTGASDQIERLQNIRIHAREFRDRARQVYLPPEEVARTYRELDQMLQSDVTAPTTRADRLILAEDVCRQAAHPYSVTHGQHHTAHVAALETVIYVTDPAAAAQLVREVSSTGYYTETNRTVVEVLPQGQTHFLLGTDCGRSFASRLFQMTAVNVHWTHHHLLDRSANTIARAGQILYEQQKPSTGADGAPDEGERLMDYAHTPPDPPSEILEPESNPARPIGHPNLTAGALADILTRISIGSNRHVVLAHERLKLPNTVTFRDEGQFEDMLARMKKEGSLPAILEVHTANEPFWTDAGGSAAGGSGAWHVVAIMDYDPYKHKVTISNQWGQWPTLVSLKDLYRSTLPPGSSQAPLRLKTGEQKALDFATELDLLWQQRSKNGISSERFDQQIASLLNRSYSDMLQRSTPDAELNHRKLEMNFARVFASLPVNEQEAVATQLDQATAPSLMKTLELMQNL